MDYDKTTLPDQYDAGRSHGSEVVEQWMRLAAMYAEPGTVTRILDLGCGTGRFTNALSEHFDAHVIGLDPSLKMLEHARAKPHASRVEFQRGHAEAIPLATGSVDFIFMSMCFHHFRDRNAAAQECRRVLRPAGPVFIRTGTSDRAGVYPYTPFFPSAFALMQAHLPPAATIRETFESAGFSCLAETVVDQTVAPDWAAYADKLATRSDSILARLTDAEFDAGVAAVRRHAAATNGVTEPIDVLVFR